MDCFKLDKTIPTILLCFMLLSNMSSQNPLHLFIEVSQEDSTLYTSGYGEFVLDDDGISGRTYMEENVWSGLLDSTLTTLPLEKSNVLFYIHGMWGHREMFLKKAHDALGKDVYRDPDFEYGIIVTLIWHSGLNYYENVKHARAVGAYFSDEVNRITNSCGKTSFLCHSMGNRVFQGLYNAFAHTPISNIEHILMLAPDLESDIFEEGNPLSEIHKICKQVTIYGHKQDFTLNMSKALNKNERLGMYIENKICSEGGCLVHIDVTSVEDNEGIGPSMSNHRYFYASPTVRDDIRLSLTNGKNPQREKVSGYNMYILHSLPQVLIER